MCVCVCVCVCMCVLTVYANAIVNMKLAVYSDKVPFSLTLKGLTHTQRYLCRAVNPDALLMYGHELYFMDLISPSVRSES